MQGFEQSGLACGIHDPSYRKANSYWQWCSERPDYSWEATAAAIGSGWPSIKGILESGETQLMGAVEPTGGALWIYRVFPAGRDSFQRPGRYFAVIFKCSRSDDILDPRVAGVLAYFEGERGLPLNCSCLDIAVPEATPSEGLRRLADECRARRHGTHWGMDSSGMVRKFAPMAAMRAVPRPEPEPNRPLDRPTHPDQEAAMWHQRLGLATAFAAGAIIGVVGGAVTGYRIGHRVASGWANREVQPPQDAIPSIKDAGTGVGSMRGGSPQQPVENGQHGSPANESTDP